MGKESFSMACFITRHYTNNSITNTSTQQITDTGNSPAPEPCGDDTGNECHQSGNGGLGSMDDGREGHDGQRHVRYIVQKGLNKLILDGFTVSVRVRHGSYRRQRHNSNINIIIHLRGLLSVQILRFPQERLPLHPASPGTGLLQHRR